MNKSKRYSRIRIELFARADTDTAIRKCHYICRTEINDLYFRSLIVFLEHDYYASFLTCWYPMMSQPVAKKLNLSEPEWLPRQ